MLQFIRSKAGSVIVKILFAVLIFAFGAWGIGDIFREPSPAETTVASVGGMKIQADTLQKEVHQEIERMRPLFGGNFDIAQAKQLGLVDSALDRLIASDLMTLEANRLHLRVDDRVVQDAIVANPAFKNSSGAFDRGVFYNILANNQLTEARYVALLRSDIAQTELTSAVTGGVVAPKALSDAIYRTRNEKRVADTVFLANDAMTGIPEPTDAELKTFHDQHQEEFRAPEYRGFTVLSATPDDLAASIKVPEDKLREEYQNRLGEFQSPEQRQLEQILVKDKAKADAVEAALAAGKDFAAVAKDEAGQDADAIKLGWVSRDEMPPALAEAAFSVAKGGTSKPVQTPLGWHIIRVTDIRPAGTKSFDEVRKQLTSDVAHEMAADQLGKESNDIEDAFAGGATLDEVAKKFDLKKTVVAAVDPDGHDPKGAAVKLPDPEVLHVAFDTDQGQTSRLTETKDNGIFVLRVDKVTPSKVKDLAEAKDQAKKLWLADKRSAAAQDEAKSLAAAVSGGKSLADVAGDKHLTVTTTPAVTRTGGGDAKLPSAVVARMFDLKSGGTGVASGTGGWYVMQVKSIENPDPEKDKTAVASISDQLGQSIRSDLVAEFQKALRTRFPVDIRQQAVDRAL